jgi:hypothetical protein
MNTLNNIKDYAVWISKQPEFHDGIEIAKSAAKGAAIGTGVSLLVGFVVGVQISSSPFIIGGAVIGAAKKIKSMRKINEEYSEIIEAYA